MAETVETALIYRPEVLGLETSGKALDTVNNAKNSLTRHSLSRENLTIQ